MQRANEHNAARAQVAAWLDGMKTLMIENPLRANAAISGTLCAVGDLIAQTIERRMDAEPMDTSHDGFLGFDVGFDPGFDAKRTGRMLVYGTFVCGPVLHFWYGALAVVSEALSVSYVPVVGSRVGSLLPWLGSFQKEAAGVITPTQLLIAKVAADGLFFQAPFLNLYFFTMGLLEGRPLREIVEKAKASFHRAWGLSLLVWTPVQLLNLSLVPSFAQPAVVSAVNVGWKTTLSILNNMHTTIHDCTAHEAYLRRHTSEQAREEERLHEELREENRALAAQVVQATEHAAQYCEQLVVVWAENEELWQRIGQQAAESDAARAAQDAARRRLLERQRELHREIESLLGGEAR